MIETPTEQRLPPLAPLQRYPQLEVDAFCTNCGYNLHAQPVTRDPNLGIFVCRCPECGRHHPAGIGVTAASLWTSRLATALLTFWVLIVLNAIFWICIGAGALTFAHIEVLTYSKMIAPDGREVEYADIPAPAGTGGATLWTPVYKGTTQPAAEVKNVRTLHRPPNGDDRWQTRFLTINLICAAGTALVSGVLLVVFMWHWRRRRYALAMLLPFLIAAGVVGLCFADDWDNQYADLRGWVINRALRYAAFEAAFLAVGILIGRPIARGLLRMFVPPNARQHFAFLWRIDGKTPPPATVPS